MSYIFFTLSSYLQGLGIFFHTRTPLTKQLMLILDNINNITNQLYFKFNCTPWCEEMIYGQLGFVAEMFFKDGVYIIHELKVILCIENIALILNEFGHEFRINQQGEMEDGKVYSGLT